MAKRLLEHRMIPFAEIISDDEVEEILSTWNLPDRQSLPLISIDDPVVLALQDERGVPVEQMVGCVVSFTRRSATAGISKFYRLIVPTGLFQVSVPSTDEGLPTWGPLNRRYAQALGGV